MVVFVAPFVAHEVSWLAAKHVVVAWAVLDPAAEARAVAGKAALVSAAEAFVEAEPFAVGDKLGLEVASARPEQVDKTELAQDFVSLAVASEQVEAARLAALARASVDEIVLH